MAPLPLFAQGGLKNPFYRFGPNGGLLSPEEQQRQEQQSATPQPSSINPLMQLAQILAPKNASQPDAPQPTPMPAGGAKSAGAGGGDWLENLRQTFASPSMMKMSLGLLAAGQRMTSTDRAKIFAGMASEFDPASDKYKEQLGNYYTAQANQAAAETERQAQLMAKMGDPEFLKSVNVTPEQAALLGPDGLTKVVSGRALQNPLDEKLKLAQIEAATAREQPKFGVIGKDPATGQDQYGFIPQYNGGPTGVPLNQPTAAPVDPNLHGPDYLSTLDPKTADRVKAVAEGRMPFPTGSALSRPANATLASQVTQFDPTFDAANTQTRFKTRAEFGTGGPNSPASTIVAGNTAIQHLGHMSDAFEKMGNTGIPAWNAVRNYGSKALGGGGDIVSFDNAKERYIEEATKFYRGTGGTEADIKRAHDMLSDANSPEQMRAAINAQMELMQGKVDALQQRWHSGMGPNTPDYDIFTPKTRETIDNITRRFKAGSEPDTGGKPAASAARPAPPPEAIAALKKNPALLNQFKQFYGEDAAKGVFGNGR